MKFRLGILAGVAAISGAAFAGTNTIVFGGVGSSAMYNSFRSAAITKSGPQSTNVYNGANGAQAVDGTFADTGDVFIGWTDPDTSGNRNIYFYVKTDSTVGVRCYFNSAKIHLLGVGTSSGFAAYSAIPADVLATVEGATFNAGMTDITPADAKVATAKALALGYNGTTNPIKGLSGTAGGTQTVNVVDFSLSARSFGIQNIGVAPIIAAVNVSDTATDGLAQASNVGRYALAGFLDGTFHTTRDLIGDTTLSATKQVVTFIREPLSGTYNTMEYCIPQSVFTSQERGISATTNNPANFTVPVYSSAATSTTITTGGRVRAIGTGNLIKWNNLTPNSLGYAFWSSGNYSVSGAGNLKYLQIDGCDPLSDAYQNSASYNFPSTPTFTNLKNGAYPAWSLLRGVMDTPSTDLVSFLNAAKSSDGNSNFVKLADMSAFRSHRATKDTTGTISNGNNSNAENGADAGGAVFPINADKDFFTDTGKELINLRLGDTKNRSN